MASQAKALVVPKPCANSKVGGTITARGLTEAANHSLQVWLSSSSPSANKPWGRLQARTLPAHHQQQHTATGKRFGEVADPQSQLGPSIDQTEVIQHVVAES